MRTDSAFAFDSQRLQETVRAGLTPELFKWLKDEHGIAFDSSLGEQQIYVPGMALDAPAQSQTVTTGNVGIPWFLANVIDPQIIAILVAPMMAEKIVGSRQMGDWASATMMMITAEATGETSVYDDYSQSGSSNVNVNYPQRQNFVFQSFLQYGDRELARAALGKIDWAAEQQRANTLILQKALNYQFMFGVANLQNYGLLNAPSLLPSLTPTYSWLGSSSATANTIYQDVVRMWIQMNVQAQGVVTMKDKLILAMSPAQSGALSEVTTYNTNSAAMLIKANFPNLRIETAPEYQTASGQLVQLIAEEIEGVKTAECVFSSKLMAHRMVIDSSSVRQKRSSSGFGAVWYRPVFEVSMLG
jgi:hypothetical protein